VGRRHAGFFHSHGVFFRFLHSHGVFHVSPSRRPRRWARTDRVLGVDDEEEPRGLQDLRHLLACRLRARTVSRRAGRARRRRSGGARGRSGPSQGGPGTSFVISAELLNLLL